MSTSNVFGSGWPQESNFVIPLSPGPKYFIGVYADGPNAVIHLHNDGEVPPRLIDGRTGKSWEGTESRMAQLRQVYEYSGADEMPGSYLRRLGCGNWSICTSLEGSDFVLMSRPGPQRNQLEFRVLYFGAQFAELEKAMAGQPHDDPEELSSTMLIALEEAMLVSWRARLRDALRTIKSNDAAQKMRSSGWLAQLRKTKLLLATKDGDLSLMREVNIAECRAKVIELRHRLTLGEDQAVGEFSEILDGCKDFYTHVVDWLMELPIDDQARMAVKFSVFGQKSKNADLQQLAVFLGGAPARIRAIEAKAVSSIGNSGASPIGGAASAGNGLTGAISKSVAVYLKPGLSKDGSTRPSGPMDKRSMAIIPDQDQELLELEALNKVKDQIQVLAFSERDGVTVPDASSLAGTVFKAVVVDKLENGQIRIEAFNSAKSAVRLVKGKYRVVVRARLNYVQAIRCQQSLSCWGRATETREARQSVETVEYFLAPHNDFRQTRLVKFGPLIPPEIGPRSVIQTKLAEVRLFLELVGRIAPN